MPHNFSQVDLSAMSDAEIGSKFPRFPVCTTCSCVTLWRVPFHSLPTFEANLHSLFPSIATAIQGRQAARVVDVHAGQALYLPAGWFHEVHTHESAFQATHCGLFAYAALHVQRHVQLLTALPGLYGR